MNISLENKTVLVTGAAGFIGAFLAEELLRRFRGIHVVGIDSMNDYYEVSLKEYRLEKLRKLAEERENAGCRFDFIRGNMADKTLVGIEEDCKAVGINMCNPILQARHLNRLGTELNIVVGLCVGHDSMFYKYSEALTTTLVAKDRVTGHSPAAPLYQLDGYYKRLLEPKGE